MAPANPCHIPSGIQSQFWIQSLEDHDYHAVMPGPRGIGHCVDLHVILLDIGYCKFPQAQDLVSRVDWLLTSHAPSFSTRSGCQLGQTWALTECRSHAVIPWCCMSLIQVSSGKARPHCLGFYKPLAFYLKRNPSNSSPSPRCCLYHRMLAQHSPDSPRPTVHRERAPNSLVPGPSGWCWTHIPLPPAAISHLLSSRSRSSS